MSCYTVIACQSQTGANIAPGGVKGPTQWYIADTTGGACYLRSNIAANISLKTNTSNNLGWINYHPSFLLNGSNRLSIVLGNDNIDNATYFTIYQSADSAKENHIWSIEKNKKTRVVLTSRRMADLDDFKYMNYTVLLPAAPKMNIYAQSKQKDTIPVTEQSWNIGMALAAPKLPVTNFNGLIPEMIAYNRVLDRQERLRVASYLALKYGITLTEPSATYMNSSGDIIWDGETYTSYHHNIAGIGRDDSSGLIQKIAASSNCPGLLTMSVPSNPANNHFLLWGDNDKTLSEAPKLAGVPVMLNRKWLLVTYGTTYHFDTELVIDTKQMDVPLPARPVYWMAIDSTGTGDFTSEGVQYIKMNSIDSKGQAHFNISWNRSGPKKNIFTFIVAQDLLLSASVIDPICASAGKGELKIKVLGGQSPYQLTVKSNAGTYIQHTIASTGLTDFITGINAGKYQITVTDARQQVYADSFYINNADAPHPVALSDSYELFPGSVLQINAAEQMESGVQYQWSGPGNFISSDPIAHIKQVGLYTLTCTKNGCSYVKDIAVNATATEAISSAMVYSNPSGGTFNVKIMLGKPSNVNMSIYTSEGSLVLTRQAQGFANYLFTNSLSAAGVYYIVIKSGLSVMTKKLIIIK